MPPEGSWIYIYRAHGTYEATYKEPTGRWPLDWKVLRDCGGKVQKFDTSGEARVYAANMGWKVLN